MADAAPPAPGSMEAYMRECVLESLELYLYPNAIFLCERLYASQKTESNAHLLATCYYRNDQAYMAHSLLRGLKSAQCRYLYARCCLRLNKVSDAEHALNPSKDSSDVPFGAAGHFLLGQIAKQTSRHQVAVQHFAAALSLDPFMWCAFEELCQMGAEEEAAALLGGSLHASGGAGAMGGGGHGEGVDESSVARGLALGGDLGTPLATVGSRGFSPSPQLLHANTPANTPINTPAATASGLDFDGPEVCDDVSMVTPSPSNFVTPSPSGAMVTPAPPPAKGAAPPPMSTGGTDVTPSTPFSGPGGGASSSVQQPRRKFLDEGKLRKVSGRLFAEPPMSLRRSSRVAAANAAAGGSAQRVAAGPPAPPAKGRGPAAGAGGGGGGGGDWGGGSVADGDGGGGGFVLGRARVGRSAIKDGQGRTTAGAQQLRSLLRSLGDGYRLLCMYRCREALQAFIALPPPQYSTGWVLSMVGRCYFELVDYPEAQRTFEWARKVSPARLEGLEWYSTVLWHLKKDVELSYLAQEAVALDRMSPHAWCVLGNCFSLQREHESALKFFQRALQLDPAFTYAHTLCGHEYFANEDFDKGLACYRAAIRCDARHYNAWYGLGQMYLRQEKYELAEYHIRRALGVNPRSSVLLCYLGMSLHKLGRNAEALEMLEDAIVADSKNPLAKFEKAGVLVSEERHEDALRELQALKDVAPREASVFFQMGKIYKKLDMADRAMVHFSFALDLKPSSSDVNLIKSAIEKLNVPDDSVDEGY